MNCGRSRCSITRPSFSAHDVPQSELHPDQQQPLEACLGWRITVSRSGCLIPAGSFLSAELGVGSKAWTKPEVEQQSWQKCACSAFTSCSY